jgi:hypothetical protein
MGEVGLFRIFLRLRGIKIVFNLGQIFYFIFYRIFAKNSFFPKFVPLSVTGMALCVDLGPKRQNLFCLV